MKLPDEVEKTVLGLYRKNNALLEGHFKLSSGLHSDIYLQSALVFKHPFTANVLGDWISRLYIDTRIDTVISAAMGGILLGQEVARAMCIPHIFAERNPVTTKLELRRGFLIEPKEKVLIIEDVITTGKTTNELCDLVYEHLGRIVGVSSVIDRSVTGSINPVPRSLGRLPLSLWKAEDCPLCAENKPIVYLGSRPKI